MVLKKLNIIQSKYSANKCPIRIALVTARAAPAHKRVINTLRKALYAYKSRINEKYKTVFFNVVYFDFL